MSSGGVLGKCSLQLRTWGRRGVVCLSGHGQILQRPVGVFGNFSPVSHGPAPPSCLCPKDLSDLSSGPCLGSLVGGPCALLGSALAPLLPALACSLVLRPGSVGLRKGLILALLALSWISCCMRTESRACALSRCKCVRIESRACPSVRPWPCARCCPRVPFFQTRGGGWCEFGRHGELGKLEP